MDYREYEPWLALTPVVSRIWTLHGNAREMGGMAQPVLPDGQPELVLHFGDAFERLHPDGRAERQPMALFAGQLTGQLTLRPTGRIAVLGVRFHPFGAVALMTVPQHRLAGLTIDVADIAGDLSSELTAVRSETDDLTEAAALVQRLLLKRMRRSRIDDRVQAAVTAIMRTEGAVSMDAVARHAAMTRRHLERRFLDHVGMPPKRLARIARFQRALRVLEEGDSPRRGTEAAADCGYADQSHFIRDFRDLAGCSPAQHLLRNAELTGFFILS
jgi:AraC-like DNA-binding protein